MNKSQIKDKLADNQKYDALSSVLEQNAIDALNSIFNESREFKDIENHDSQFNLSMH